MTDRERCWQVSKSMRILTYQSRQYYMTHPLSSQIAQERYSFVNLWAIFIPNWGKTCYLNGELATRGGSICHASYSWRGNKIQTVNASLKKDSGKRQHLGKQGVSTASSSPWDEQGSELHSVLHSTFTLLKDIPSFQLAFSGKGVEELSQHLISPQPYLHLQLGGEMEQSCSNSQASWGTPSLFAWARHKRKRAKGWL